MAYSIDQPVHPWTNNDGVYITPAGCPCRILSIDEEGNHRLEVYFPHDKTVTEWVTDSWTFLNRYKTA